MMVIIQIEAREHTARTEKSFSFFSLLSLFTIILPTFTSAPIKILASFDEALHAVRLHHEPSLLVRYLYDVMHLSNKAFRTLPVKAVVDTDLGVARIMLFRCARIVLANGMKLLGVDPLEMM